MCALCLPEQLVVVEMGETEEDTGVLGGKNQCFGLRSLIETGQESPILSGRVLSVDNRKGCTKQAVE